MTTPKIRRLLPLALAAGLVVAGCGAEEAPTPAPQANAGGRPTCDAGQPVALSASDHDRLLSATFDPGNRLYAAGWVGEGADQSMAVTRFGADGSVDRAFGADGVAKVNVARGGKAVELARSVVVQSDGKVVVAGPVEQDPAASGDAAKETDIALARFDETGKLDASFGDGGVIRLDLSATDTVWGLVKVTGNRLLVVGSQVGVGPGQTEDFAVVRLRADGTKDEAFGAGGVAVVGTGPDISEVPKTAVELPDGKVVVAGYASTGGVISPVLFRLTVAGALDPTFGDSGIAVRPILGKVTEAYSVVVAGNRLVTTGYGKDTADAKVDLVANGFTLDGALDESFGTSGLTRVDVAGEDDRGRNLVALPDGRTVLVGSGKTSASNLDAMVVRLTPAGGFDPAFGEGGRKLYDV